MSNCVQHINAWDSPPAICMYVMLFIFFLSLPGLVIRHYTKKTFLKSLIVAVLGVLGIMWWWSSIS